MNMSFDVDKISSSRQRKFEQVKVIKNLLDKTTILVVLKNDGLSVPDVTKLRLAWLSSNLVLKTFCNRLFRLASDGTLFQVVSSHVKGPVFFIFSSDSCSALARLLYGVRRTHVKMKPLFFVMDGCLYDFPATVDALMQFPTKEEALAKLLHTLSAPLSCCIHSMRAVVVKFLQTLIAVKNKRG
jgi:large subunit ribosomal protein L10